MPEKHGLSVAAYRRKYRHAWDARKTDDKYRTKMLVDDLLTEHSVRRLGEGMYVDEATWRSYLDHKKSKKNLISHEVQIVIPAQDGIQKP